MPLKYTSETDNRTWYWDGDEWAIWTGSTGGGGGGGGGDCCVIFSETPPEEPFASMRWFDLTSGIEYIYYEDGDSAEWIAPGPGAKNASIREIPYDLTFAAFGYLSNGHTVGSVLLTRTVSIAATAPLSLAKIKNAPTSTPLIINIYQIKSTVPEILLGNITFPVGSTNGIITFTSPAILTPSDLMQLRIASAVDDINNGITISIVSTYYTE